MTSEVRRNYVSIGLTLQSCALNVSCSALASSIESEPVQSFLDSRRYPVGRLTTFEPSLKIWMHKRYTGFE